MGSLTIAFAAVLSNHATRECSAPAKKVVADNSQAPDALIEQLNAIIEQLVVSGSVSHLETAPVFSTPHVASRVRFRSVLLGWCFAVSVSWKWMG